MSGGGDGDGDEDDDDNHDDDDDDDDVGSAKSHRFLHFCSLGLHGDHRGPMHSAERERGNNCYIADLSVTGL